MIALKDIYLFKDISPEFINLIIDNSRRMEVKAGEIILSEWTPSNDEAYIIQEWEVEVSIKWEVIKTLAAPEIFWEIALITDEVRTATVEAKTDLILLRINKTLLHTILKEFQNWAEIQRIMRERILENLKK